MNWPVTAALVQKDLALLGRNRFFAFIAVFGLLFYALVYYLMPGTVEEGLDLALYAPEIPPLLLEELQQGEEEITIWLPGSREGLQELVSSRQVELGVAFPGDILERLAAGEEVQVETFYTGEVPGELVEAYNMLVALIFNQLGGVTAGTGLEMEVEEEVLGPGKPGQSGQPGKPVPPRDRMVPLFVVFLLLTETMSLASLLGEEIEGHTLQALLVTPVNLGDIFLSKGVYGVGLAFVQAALLLGITGGLGRDPLLVLGTLLPGSLLVTGLGFLIASISRDFMSVMGWGMVAMVVLSLPAFGLLFPGMAAGWIRFIPSHHLVETLDQVINFGAGWRETWGDLAVLLAWGLGFMALGIKVLGGKLR